MPNTTMRFATLAFSLFIAFIAFVPSANASTTWTPAGTTNNGFMYPWCTYTPIGVCRFSSSCGMSENGTRYAVACSPTGGLGGSSAPSSYQPAGETCYIDLNRQIEIANQTCSAASISISASPNPTYTNSLTPLSWSASDASNIKSCTITGTDGFGSTVFTGNQASVSGTTYAQPSADTTYTITCTYGVNQTAAASVLLRTQCPSGGNSPATCANIPIPGIVWPNLTSVVGSSLTITPGNTVNLTGTVRNTAVSSDPTVGNATYFEDTFQIALSNQSTIVESITVGVPSLAQNSLVNHSRTSSYNFPSTGTYYYRMCADTRTPPALPSYQTWGDILEGFNDTDSSTGVTGDNCSGWTAITVAPPPMPDVTPSVASGPTSLAVGQTGTWSATTYNVGNAGTGVNVPVAFAINNADLSARVAEVYTASGPIASGGSAATSVSYAFSAPGTYWIIPCSDVASPWHGTFNESNEGNNCGASWLQITVYAVPTANLSLSPTSVAYGGSSTISWSSTGATSCTGTGFNTGNATSGSVAVSATVSTTYYLSCSGPGGTSPTRNATLTVGAQAFSDLTPGAIPNVYVPFGQSVTVTGTVYNGGNAATGASFNNMFVTNLNAQGTAWNTAVTAAPVTSDLGVGGAATFSYTFPASTFAAPGTYPYADCVDVNAAWAGLINESNENNNCYSATIVITIPDLTAGSVTPTTATAGTPASLTATASNIGNATSGSFPMLFQVQSPAANVNSSYLAAIPAGSTGAGSASYTFPSAGTYQVRACANQNTSGTFIVTESNYGNNCGAWQSVIVTAAPVASGTISANPIACTAATTGGSCSTTVTWSSQNLSAAQVWVKVNGEATGAQMSGGTSGTNAVPWIAAGSYYDFVLYDYSSGSKGAQLSVVRVTGVNPAAADLTAGSVTPTTATAGTPRTLSATASNTGNAPSGSFPMLFQVSQTGALVNSAYVAAIPTGGSGSGTASYTFPSAGTYQVRACANNNTSWVNIVTESNYSNNCGAWTVVVVAAAVPPSVSCVVDQSSVPVGASVTYTATPANGATSPYTWVASDGASVGSASTATRTFAAPGNYAMTAKGSNTVAANCPMVSVAATWCTTATPALSITASSVRVKAGQTATISWSASGVNGQNATCTVTGPGVSWSSAVSAAPVCSVPSGSATPTINTQSTYTLSCGSQSKSVTVNVIPNFTEF